jgi:RNA polymerase sigma-70 factor (ECF subfamily)
MPDTTYPDMLEAVRHYLVRSSGDVGVDQPQDRAAWERFYQRYHEILTRFARNLRFQSVEIDDLLQDVWCEVIRQLPKFEYERARGGFRRWLFVIVRRRAIDHVRQRVARRGTGPMTAHFFNSGVEDPRAPDPVAALDRQFKTEILQEAIDLFRQQATDGEWQSFSLCRLEGLNSSLAAQRLGTTPEAIRKRLERANLKLRHALTELVGVGDEADAGDLC